MPCRWRVTMTFEEWIAQQPWELEVGSGRYEDMRMAFRAGKWEIKTRLLDMVAKESPRVIVGITAAQIRDLSLEGDDG